MVRIREKLKSQSGVSFLLALLAFLVAAMVSVTIVAAAVTTVKRVNSDRESQQAQLTLISAAQFVRDEMKKTKYVVTTVTSSPSQAGDGVTKDPDGIFGAEMQDAVEAVNRLSNLGDPYKLDDAFKIEVSGFKMEPVNVSFVMKAGEGEHYRVVFTLSIEDSSEKLFLTMSGNKDEQTKTETDTITTVDPGSPGGEKTETITTTTYIETYTWDKGIINGIGDTNESKT